MASVMGQPMVDTWADPASETGQVPSQEGCSLQPSGGLDILPWCPESLQERYWAAKRNNWRNLCGHLKEVGLAAKLFQILRNSRRPRLTTLGDLMALTLLDQARPLIAFSTQSVPWAVRTSFPQSTAQQEPTAGPRQGVYTWQTFTGNGPA